MPKQRHRSQKPRTRSDHRETQWTHQHNYTKKTILAKKTTCVKPDFARGQRRVYMAAGQRVHDTIMCMRQVQHTLLNEIKALSIRVGALQISLATLHDPQDECLHQIPAHLWGTVATETIKRDSGVHQTTRSGGEQPHFPDTPTNLCRCELSSTTAARQHTRLLS